jgi:hypothetical protein
MIIDIVRPRPTTDLEELLEVSLWLVLGLGEHDVTARHKLVIGQRHIKLRMAHASEIDAVRVYKRCTGRDLHMQGGISDHHGNTKIRVPSGARVSVTLNWRDEP